MKYWSSIAALVFLAAQSHASPYFRLIDLSHPATSVGALIDPSDTKNTASATLVALITHDPKDGCLVPGVCESWTPLAVGPSLQSGHWRIAMGPSANLLPWTKAGLLMLIEHLTSQDQLSGVKSLLAPAPVGAVALSGGPLFVLSPTENFKGYFRVWSGASWRF